MNIFLFLILILFWGCSFLAIKYVLEIFPPFYSAFLRTFLTFCFISIYILFRKIPLQDQSFETFIKWSVLGLVAFTIPWAALFWGEQYIPPALVGMLNSTVPIFALVISFFVIPNERISPLGVFGLVLGFFGMGAIFLPTLKVGMFKDMVFWGMIAILIMSLAYSVNTVWARKWGRKIHLVWAIWIQTLSGSLTLLVLAILMGEVFPSFDTMGSSPKSVWGMLYLAFFSTALAIAFYYHLIDQWGAVKASSVNYGIPFVAIIVDFLVFGHLPSLAEWVGVAFIMLGLVLLHKSKMVITR